MRNMKNRKRYSRIVSFLLTVVMVVASVFPSFASEEGEQITNIALNKTVAISGTGNENDGASAANDGNLNTKWVSASVKKNGQNLDKDAWIYIDLGTDHIYEFNQVVVKYYKKMYPVDCELQISDSAEDGSWTTIKRGALTAGITPTNDTVTETMDLDATASARYVRLHFNEINGSAAVDTIGVREFEIYGRTKSTADKSELENLIASAREKAQSSAILKHQKWN